MKQVAGTEDGIKEPTATFSACFGAAFIMLHPTKYAAMLAEKMKKHGATGWLVNTGWSGGRYEFQPWLVVLSKCITDAFQVLAHTNLSLYFFPPDMGLEIVSS